MPKQILLTGGAGFIGSHTCVALVEAGYEVTILDNFENSQTDVIDRLKQVTNSEIKLIQADICDIEALRNAVHGGIDAVVHFAARKSVPEGEADPIGYYKVNCGGLMNLVEVMQEVKIKKLVFSSSAAVYGDAKNVPVSEQAPMDPQNVYASTKGFNEVYLNSVAKVDSEFCIGILRYFNPVGAHPSGLIGEDPAQPPTNLIPVISRVARGELPNVTVFGGDYPTPDGTGIRDYIHVQDLAQGHVNSVHALFAKEESHTVNLGTGVGHSVLEVLHAYSQACGKNVPYRVEARRPGDAAISFADVSRAKEVLGFSAKHDLMSMCESNWAYSSKL